MQRPRIYLAIVLPALLCGLVPVAALEVLYARTAGVHMSAIPTLNGVLIALPAFVLWIPVSLMASNLIMYAVPTLRSTAAAFAARSGLPPFAENQRRLAVATTVLAVICTPLIAWGFYA